ncbi:FecR domain-containing protein [Sphingosinicella sp. CPCC 101087]|uniref:FecR family protein n=1 Tax=Sphingosinicella sp. CPCC 101087 TaxID=2497754 RepID=UPI00101CF2CD|nr:FecR domain-containing protein [Sphingosinicella sp. CPCC 101087]
MSARDRIEETAAAWLVRQEDPAWTGADQAELQEWLDRSMAHKAAYWRLEHGWRQADRISALGGGVRPAVGPNWSSRPILALAASLIAALALGVVLLVQAGSSTGSAQPDAAVRQAVTPVGGQRRLALADGSRVELNTDTDLRYAIGRERREIWLERGEAFFEVARAPGLPFVVHAGPRTVTVLGTRFSVRREGDRVSVAVLEGRVRVDEDADPAPGRSATLVGGDLAIAQGTSTLLTGNSAERVHDALGWRRGMLIFSQSTLADAVAEFNRYNRVQLIVADPAAAEIRIGGSFHAGNARAFARLLRDAYGLRLKEQDGSILISS